VVERPPVVDGDGPKNDDRDGMPPDFAAATGRGETAPNVGDARRIAAGGAGTHPGPRPVQRASERLSRTDCGAGAICRDGGWLGRLDSQLRKSASFKPFEKASLSGKPEIQVRQSGKTVKQTIFCLALSNSRALTGRGKSMPL
jgi:hypothetical protein